MVCVVNPSPLPATVVTVWGAEAVSHSACAKSYSPHICFGEEKQLYPDQASLYHPPTPSPGSQRAFVPAARLPLCLHSHDKAWHRGCRRQSLRRRQRELPMDLGCHSGPSFSGTSSPEVGSTERDLRMQPALHRLGGPGPDGGSVAMAGGPGVTSA